MNTIQKGIILLVKSAVTQQAQALPEGFSLEAAMPMIRRHSLMTLCYDGAVRCGISKTDPAMQKLFMSYCKALQISEGQMKQIRRVCKAFEEDGIDYLPLKGCRMKQLYPAPELRAMSDADILIRKEQYSRIQPLMQELGYQPGVESDHEFVWKHPQLYLELHKCLIPSYNQDFYSYFGDGWHLAEQEEGFRYGMKLEDQFLYELTHFAKHFRDGGIGIRHVTDLWVYRLRYPELEGDALRRELSKLKLDVFYGRIRHLIEVWFGDEPEDELSEFLTSYIFASGNYGQEEERFLSDMLQRAKSKPVENAYAGYVLSKVFPRRQDLAARYPILWKAPWLTPAVWIHWAGHKILFERDSVRQRMEQAEMASGDKLESRRKMLQTMGLDF